MAKVNLEQDGDVGIITISNPPLNLFVPELVDDLERIAGELEGMDLRALLMRAEGDMFSGGADVTQMFQGRSAKDAKALLTRFNRLLPRYENLPCPTVVATQGMCLAAGLELALACDIIWAGESAQLGLVEAVIGATPFGGGVQRLAQRAGSARAFEMVYTGRIYDAPTLERWNIINRVVPDDELQDKTLKFAHKLAQGPTLAHGATRRVMRTFLDEGMRAADDLIPEVAASLFESEDMRNGIESLLEKGPGQATFTGK